MLGLQRGKVALSAYDPQWAKVFAEEEAVIREGLGELAVDIQHVGSTAVPGLEAKPILDIVVCVASPEQIAEAVRGLVELGYIDAFDQGREGGYLLWKESRPEVRIIHTHVVAQNDPQWRNYLLFRDVLRRDEAVRSRYVQLKRDLARRFRDRREDYTAAKGDFIREVLRSHRANT